MILHLQGYQAYQGTAEAKGPWDDPQTHTYRKLIVEFGSIKGRRVTVGIWYDLDMGRVPTMMIIS